MKVTSKFEQSENVAKQKMSQKANSYQLKIIVRAPNWVGDCVLAIPFLKFLREINPGAKITILAKSPGSEIFEGNPIADEVWMYENFWETAERIRKEKFDVGYILPNSFSSAFLFFIGGVRERTGYSTDMRSLFLTQAIPWKRTKEHRTLSYCRLAGLADADRQITPASHPAEIFPDKTAIEHAQYLLKDLQKVPLIAINPCSNASSRRWPVEKYALLAQKLTTNLKTEILLLGSGIAEDKNLALEVVAKCDFEIRNLCGKTTLKSLAAVLKEADVLVTSDTGIMHIAAGVKTPILALVGAGDMKVTGPWSTGKFEIINKNVYCSPCVKNRCINRKEPMLCMESIEVDEVVSAVEKMIK